MMRTRKFLQGIIQPRHTIRGGQSNQKDHTFPIQGISFRLIVLLVYYVIDYSVFHSRLWPLFLFVGPRGGYGEFSATCVLVCRMAGKWDKGWPIPVYCRQSTQIRIKHLYSTLDYCCRSATRTSFSSFLSHSCWGLLLMKWSTFRFAIKFTRGAGGGLANTCRGMFLKRKR